MSKAEGLFEKYFRAILWIAAFAAVVYLVVRNINILGNILLVALGFGAVVLIHEFGHFIFAKLSRIKVEAFSIGFPPTLAGILKMRKGWRIRILPKFFPKEDDESGDGRLSFTIGQKVHQPGETEYRIGVIPFGGFVKMLGQEDVGPVKTSDDPRSYANKPVGVRMAVISAGVVFNVISALIVFMMVFLIGINLTPAVVGGVVPNSPAAHAGLKAGDEIIEIAGRSGNLDFSNVLMAAVLSERDEKVALKVEHEDGSIEDFAIVAERMQTLRGPMRSFGIDWPMSLTIAKVSDANELLARTGLLAGDRIKSVNGRDVQTHWELERMVEDALVSEVTILAERSDKSGKVELIESRIPLDLSFENREPKSESDLAHIYSMVPRLRIKAVDTKVELQNGDIILAVGDVENPTYKEIRDVTTEYEKKELPIKVLRADSNGVEGTFTVTVVPKRSQDGKRVVIGIFPVFDADHAVVAKTIAVEGGPAKLEIPRGATITAVGGVDVSSFYDVVREIRQNTGKRVTIDYRLDEEETGGVALEVKADEGFVTVKSTFAEFVPFEDLKRLYKASGPIDAVVIGCKKTIMRIAQTYVSIRCLVGGLVSSKELSGPVGIIAMTYRIATEQPLIYYVYFLGIISVLLAVFNFLPLLPFDGGHIVLLLVEKIKGSALSERTQGIIAYAGVVFIIAVFLYLTFNDIINIFFS